MVWCLIVKLKYLSMWPLNVADFLKISTFNVSESLQPSPLTQSEDVNSTLCNIKCGPLTIRTTVT